MMTGVLVAYTYLVGAIVSPPSPFPDLSLPILGAWVQLGVLVAILVGATIRAKSTGRKVRICYHKSAASWKTH